MGIKTFAVWVAYTSLGICAVLAPADADAEEWEWVIAPYLWAANVGVDLDVNGDPVLGVDIPFRDIIDKLDMAFMAHVEGRKGNYGLYADYIYMALSDSSVVSFNTPGPIIGDLTVESDLKMRLLDIGGMRRFGSPDPGSVAFDLLAGARLVDIELNTLITLPGPAMTQVDASIGPSETDLMLGGRLVGHFNPRWNWMLRGDVSFGGTEGSINGLALVGYEFGETGLFSLRGGYRHMQIEVKSTTPSGASAETEMSFSGPILGFVFSF